ncbi:hypothetical protein LPU83_pLPU83d_1272 (plasmid) [Rhizobium favelukesii]|uniref:Uncharacterized protein n=1 Tax=Rhizobium favelukesii TaxID=348824 RepID=W6RNH3_9HYPH|nr:hypothetical protein LPU83_pLPU83d_1272 [Rhizobium favelukesii]
MRWHLGSTSRFARRVGSSGRTEIGDSSIITDRSKIRRSEHFAPPQAACTERQRLSSTDISIHFEDHWGGSWP